MSWSLVYLLMGGLIVRHGADRAPGAGHAAARRSACSTRSSREPGALEPQARLVALAIVGVSWAWAIFTIAHFMVSMLTHGAGRQAALGRRFHQALWAVDHLRDGDRAADRRRGDQLAEGASAMCSSANATHSRAAERRSTTFMSRWSLRSASFASASAGAC